MSIPTTDPSSASPQQSAAPDQSGQPVAGTASQQQQQQQQSAPQPVKRSSRRANTAERRATHNAVERARRETLNSRFLDLAAMLPNLAAVRRPSKSAIVNSSIALIHNQQRARIIAARELRLINAETQALRNELNEWRMRNNLPRVEEPLRSTDFATLLAVEDVEMGEEMIVGPHRRSFDDGYMGGMGDDDGDFGEDGDDNDLVSPDGSGLYGNMGLPARGAPMQYPTSQPPQQQQQQVQATQQQQQLFEQQKAAMARAQFAQQQAAQAQAQAQARYTPPASLHHQHSQSQPTMIFPADLYAPTAAAGNEAFPASWSQKAINALTPPGSAHGVNNKTSPYATTANSAFLSGPAQQQGMFKPPSYTSGYLGVSTGSEDDQSDGSSHFSGMSDLLSAGEQGQGQQQQQQQQQFSFGLSSNTSLAAATGLNVNFPNAHAHQYGMIGYGMMQLPPSPPHTGSPASIQSSRRASVHIPAAGGSAKSSPGPSPIPVSGQYGMGLMI